MNNNKYQATVWQVASAIIILAIMVAALASFQIA